MINSFENYLKFGKVKRKTPDFAEAKALFQKSLQRLDYIKSNKINQTTATFILEDAYETIREAAQALMSIQGYKPYSHEATISFVKEKYKDTFNESDISKFNRFRLLRNNSIYKAEQVSIEDAKESLKFAKSFIPKIKKIIKNHL